MQLCPSSTNSVTGASELGHLLSAPGMKLAIGNSRNSFSCHRPRLHAPRQLHRVCSAHVNAYATRTPVAPCVETVDVQISTETTSFSSFNRYRALVLDTSYRPIDIVNWQRAICLDLFDKVDVLEYYDALVHSARHEFMIPAVLRVRMYIHRDNKGKISLTRRNLLLRDNNTCQYCGCGSDLTVDHVKPVSKGGLWEWSNLVTACNKCNGKKGSKTLKQLGWKLKRIPCAPSAWQVGVLVGMDRNVHNSPKEWADYLFPGSTSQPEVTQTVSAPLTSIAGQIDPLIPVM
ncbi:hypothetical protein ABBQ38_000239 [Trebouxia sp. C0009 RCD-2024]